MKKLIAIDNLQVGMFLDAEAVTESKDGEDLKYLSARNSVGGVSGKRARLTGRMHEKIEAEDVSWIKVMLSDTAPAVGKARTVTDWRAR